MSVDRNYLLSLVFASNSLEYYDSRKELKTIQKWYEMVWTSPDVSKSVKQLEDEAKNSSGKPGSRMFEYLQRARKENKTVSGLTPAECLVVIMYTDDSDARAFFREYNMASKTGNWSPYKVYTILLVSALRKLAEINRLPSNKPLYRGLSFGVNPPTAQRIFWKSFASATLSIHVAREFAGPGGTILEFQPPASRYGAQVGHLSTFAEEQEVILLPFEAFDFMGADGRKFYFKSSKTQELLVDFEDASTVAYYESLNGL